jgi:3-mercaptopyruvate sulfurtransferase SseA
VSADKDVVLIDPGHMMAASQAWLWLRSVGLKRLFVVNGGVDALVSSGLRKAVPQIIVKPSSLQNISPDGSVGFLTIDDVKSLSKEAQVRGEFLCHEAGPPRRIG